MVFKEKTEVFLVKRSIIITLVLLGLSIIFFEVNKEVIFGLLTGYLISLLRLRILSDTVTTLVKKAANHVKKRMPAKYIAVQMLTIIVLILAIKRSIPFFMACFAGVLIIQLTILVNSISELLGITRNNFE